MCPIYRTLSVWNICPIFRTLGGYELTNMHDNMLNVTIYNDYRFDITHFTAWGKYMRSNLRTINNE